MEPEMGVCASESSSQAVPHGEEVGCLYSSAHSVKERNVVRVPCMELTSLRGSRTTPSIIVSQDIGAKRTIGSFEKSSLSSFPAACEMIDTVHVDLQNPQWKDTVFAGVLLNQNGTCRTRKLPVDARVSSERRGDGPVWATDGTESGNADKKRLAIPVVARELVVFSSAGRVKGEADNSFCSGGDLVRRPPNLARRCPFPAVTHPTRRGLPDSTGSTLDGMSLL